MSSQAGEGQGGKVKRGQDLPWDEADEKDVATQERPDLGTDC